MSWLDTGSPAGRAKLYAQRSVVSVDGVDTPDLDAFLDVVRAKDPEASVRLELLTRTGEREVITVEPDERFFPTEELRRVDGVWERRPSDPVQNRSEIVAMSERPSWGIVRIGNVSSAGCA